MLHTAERWRQYILKTIRSFSVANLNCSDTRSQSGRVNCVVLTELVYCFGKGLAKASSSYSFYLDISPWGMSCRELPPRANPAAPLCHLLPVGHWRGRGFLHRERNQCFKCAIILGNSREKALCTGLVNGSPFNGTSKSPVFLDTWLQRLLPHRMEPLNILCGSVLHDNVCFYGRGSNLLTFSHKSVLCCVRPICAFFTSSSFHFHLKGEVHAMCHNMKHQLSWRQEADEWSSYYWQLSRRRATITKIWGWLCSSSCFLQKAPSQITADR